jgi:hypothetical protein
MYEGATSNPPADYPDDPDAPLIVEGIADDASDPIPVIVVDTVSPSDYTDWAPEQFSVIGENPAHIAGSRNNRVRLLVINTGPDTVYLIKGSVSGAFTGAPLPMNMSLELTTNRDVYATCLTGDSAIVGVVQEFVIDDDA